MKKNTSKQYTIRNIPQTLDQTLKQKSKETGKSFNQTALEALILGAGETLRPRDLHFIVGTLNPKEAKELEENIKSQRVIDSKIWK